MKQRLHDLLQSFKKDSGAHFTYDLGVSLVRASAVSLAIGVLILVLSMIFPPTRLKYIGEVQASIKEMHRDNKYSSTAGLMLHCLGLKDKNDIYVVVFEFDLNGEHIISSQRITEECYQGMLRLEPLGSIKLKLYERKKIRHYLSYMNKHNAEKECQKADPELGYAEFSWVAFILAIVLWLVGRREERIAMKYPRSDVPYEQHALVPFDGAEATAEDAGFEPAGPVQYALTDNTGEANEQTDP